MIPLPMKSGLSSEDTINGGDGTDELVYKDAGSASNELKNVTKIETVTATNTTTDVSVTLTDNTVAAAASMAFTLQHSLLENLSLTVVRSLTASWKSPVAMP